MLFGFSKDLKKPAVFIGIMAKNRAVPIIYSESEEQSMDIDFVPPPEKPKKVSLLLKILFWGWFLISSTFSLLSGEMLGGSIYNGIVWMGLTGLFAFVFSELCVLLAKKIAKNLDFAWALGFLFGFIGLGVYWVYYMISSRKVISERKENVVGKIKSNPKKRKR